MQTKNITQKILLSCSPQDAFDAWLDSKIHGEIIGTKAEIDPKIGGKFSLWDGEMTGKTTAVDSKKLTITQEWRDNGSDWPVDYYSVITVTFLPAEDNKAELIFSQTGIPEEHAKDIEKGWQKFYWEPMKQYFLSKK